MAFGLSVLLFIVSLFLIVMIHEGGHYLAARRFNFRVLEYFLGFGPRLWSFRRGEIEYGVKAIPAGGYVKIAGMNPYENDVPEGDEHRAYTAKPVWQRITVILAGPFSHFVVAYLIFAAVFFFAANWNIPGIAAVDPVINGQPSPAAVAGMQPGDVILQIGDLAQPNLNEVGAYQAAHVGQPIVYVVDRDGQQVTLTATPVETETDGVKGARIGIQMAGVKEGAVGALEHAGGSLWDTTREAATGITTVFGPHGVPAHLFPALQRRPARRGGRRLADRGRPGRRSRRLARRVGASTSCCSPPSCCSSGCSTCCRSRRWTAATSRSP